MKQQIETKEDLSCPRAEIAAYLDGELSGSEELRLEKHFAVCKRCETEFNEQKKLLNALDFALNEKTELPVPEDFARTVVIKAESRVSGLRSREERYRALFLCAVLFLLTIVGLGSETEAVFSTVAVFLEQVLAVGGFTAHLVYNVAFALTAILRLIGGQFIHSAALGVAGVGVFLISVVYFFARLIPVFDRSKV
jgi:anti-sigma factor RsiW